MNKVKEIKTESATEAFRRKIKELKPKLPDNWKLLFIAEHPEYDSYRGGVVLHNVINGRSTDQVVLEGLEKIVNGLK